MYLDDGTIIDLVVGVGHVVFNKNNAHLVCHGFSQAAADLLQHAEHYRSECIIPGDGETFELTELNVSTPSAKVTFVCQLP